jgi:mono/diheme cytochrome c family protein
MNRWLRRSAIALALLAAAAGSAALLGDQLARSRAERKVDIKVQPLAYRSDAAALERGRYLFNSRGCVDCHGAAGGGRTMVDDGKGLHIAGPNLTAGNPRLAAYAEADWVRSVRHGVAPGGRPLRVMPSEDYNRLTNDDLASLVAYVRHLPPATGREQAIVQLPLPARVMYGFGLLPDAVEKIDHSLPPATPVPEGATVEHGRYVAQMCLGCHGAQLAGGRIPGAPPDWPAAARLDGGEGSAMPRYADTDAFAKMLKSGRRPDGSRIAVMPFESLAQMSPTDTQALFVYLKSLQAAPH